MKKIILITAVLLGCSSMNNASAQIGFKMNIGSQPLWGPIGYNHVEYYYMPDIDAYYYVPSRQFYYANNGTWVNAPSLPQSYNYDIYNGYKVVINDPFPYRRADFYRVKYAKYKGKKNQVIIRNSNEYKYYQIKDHPGHSKWKGNNGNGKNGDNGYKNNGNGNKENGRGNKKGHKGKH